ncbi:Putative NUDIX hydrolase domain, NADH pyrophosphatase-like, Zinc ribbon, NADH pyrophosphatase [Septoria linicola]|uniref:NAD(+) diphosphatase n=1 Tax=Septoria linicola TaxID=215465 RepID=A0A9Q9AQ16_9PEZI|nr:putative NUDIX hydrolase domain, NADH pyrophosphatase-like, Zinc ribbon, NADH pyrophosphatase [Septoria linicola]USW52374.1 Putative NUDIX hydrolase domain, NADH pyrophosphatase-like, Zinc ribbon, NADH pyrophosphatase [Septoria linicola]
MAPSTLTEIFGVGNNAYFSNGKIDRLAFLRTQHELLDKASKHPSARYLTFNELNALRDSDGNFAYVGYDDLKFWIGEPYEKDEKTQIQDFNPAEHHPRLIFLGLDLEAGCKTPAVSLGLYYGVPYFALDVSSSHYDRFKSRQKSQGRTHVPTRVDLNLSHGDSAILSHARSLIDWNTRNRFCGACGGKMLSTHGGSKVVCPPADAGVPRKTACPTRTGLHNQAFPRTDPTVVIAPVAADAKRVLLGRGKRWPENYFSCLSGFVEPGESLEVATRREAFEETGVRLAHVQIHSSQPWPYPSTLLIGAMGQCIEGGEDITYPESELEEAKWFELDEIEHALNNGANAMWEPPIKGYVGPRVPPAQLMAHQTLRGVLKLFKRH